MEMDRRIFLTAGATSVLATTAIAAAQQPEKPAGGEHVHEHQHGHDHAGMGKLKYGDLMKEATHCVTTGEVCLSHCLETFAGGDTTLAVCASKVRELIAATGSLAELSAMGSSYVPAMSKVVLQVCQDCEKECRKHEKHATCKACADACASCAEECRKVDA